MSQIVQAALAAADGAGDLGRRFRRPHTHLVRAVGPIRARSADWLLLDSAGRERQESQAVPLHTGLRSALRRHIRLLREDIHHREEDGEEESWARDHAEICKFLCIYVRAVLVCESCFFREVTDNNFSSIAF